MRLVATLGCALALAPVAVAAQPLDTAGVTQCKVRGWAKDTDRKGTNVRSAARVDAPIIGHLAPLTDIGQNTWTGVEFDIVAYKDGWFLIKNGDPRDGLTFNAQHDEDGRGWVSAKLVSTTLGTFIFRTAPRRDAPAAARIEGDSWGPYSLAVLAVHGCSGSYVDVTVRPYDGGAPVRGWSFWPCSNQLTTCDRPNPDDAEASPN